MWNILGEGPLKRTDEADDEAVILLFGADDLDEGPLAWQERALCAQTDPEAFFPEKRDGAPFLSVLNAQYSGGVFYPAAFDGGLAFVSRFYEHRTLSYTDFSGDSH